MGEGIEIQAARADLSTAQARRGLLLILAAGLALRLVLCFWFYGRPLHVWDERDYDTLAINLVQNGEYALEPGVPTSMRPPAYPFLLAGVYWCFGLGHLTDAQHAARLMQAVLSLMTVLLVYRLGEVVYSRRIGLWAAGLTCFYPSLVGTANLLLTETLFTFFLCAVCLTLVRFIRSGSLAAGLLAGCLIGLAALTRSVLWLFPPVVGVYLLFAMQAPFVRRLLGVAVMLTAFTATIAPWSIRNTQLQQTFITIDTMGGRNLMMANYEHTPQYRAWDAISIHGDTAWYSVLAARRPEYHHMTQGQRDKLALREGLRFVIENPGLTLQRNVIRFFNFWQLERELVAGAQRGYYGDWATGWATGRLNLGTLGLAAVICGAYVGAMISGIFGMCVTPPAWRYHGLLLLLLAYVNGMHVLSFAHSRYHLPLMPIVLIYAAAALSGPGEIWRQRSRPSFWLAVGLSMLLIGGWLWETPRTLR